MCTYISPRYKLRRPLASLRPPLAEPRVEYNELSFTLSLVVGAQVHVGQYVGLRPLTGSVHQVYSERVEEWTKSANEKVPTEFKTNDAACTKYKRYHLAV